jgi:HAD superfamily hydrolase (TIGR01458 family)
VSWIAGAAGALIDLDGTLVDVGRGPMPGAAGFLERLHARGHPYKICSNSTRRSRDEVAREMATLGLSVRASDIVLPASLARRTIVSSARRRALLLVPEGCRPDFDGIEAVSEVADWVVIGDLGREMNADRLDAALRALLAGARLLALHKNPRWNAGPERGIVLDAGAYVAALEYGSGVEATVVGKPSRAFYELALAELGLAAKDVVMIGDNIANDLVGAAAAGCRTCVVRGTAFREDALAAATARPDLLVDSVAELAP